MIGDDWKPAPLSVSSFPLDDARGGVHRACLRTDGPRRPNENADPPRREKQKCALWRRYADNQKANKTKVLGRFIARNSPAPVSNRRKGWGKERNGLGG